MVKTTKATQSKSKSGAGGKEKKLDLAAAVMASVRAMTRPRESGGGPPAAFDVAPSRALSVHWPAGSGAKDDAWGQMIINTGAFRADGAVQVAVVTNDTGREIRLTSTRIWLGVSYGGICDAHGQLTRNDGSTVAVVQFDHYAPGSAGAGCETTIHPRPFALPPGWSLALSYMANGFGRPGVQAHFTVTVQGYYE